VIGFADSNISERTLRESGCLKLHFAAVSNLKKIQILRIGKADRIHLSGKERFQAFLQAKPAIRSPVPILT
jgi:hypothetical protein